MIISSTVNWAEGRKYAFAYMLELVETGVSGSVGALIHQNGRAVHFDVFKLPTFPISILH